MITRYNPGSPQTVSSPGPVHYVVRYLGDKVFAGYCQVGEKLFPIEPTRLRSSQLEAKLDCILSGIKTLKECPHLKSFTVEEP